MQLESDYVGQWFLTKKKPIGKTVGELVGDEVNSIKLDNEGVVGTYIQDILKIGFNKYLFIVNIYHNYENINEIKFR
jgi:hypothetical protein